MLSVRISSINAKKDLHWKVHGRFGSHITGLRLGATRCGAGD